MATRTRPRKSLAYKKEDLLLSLRDALSRIEATIKTHEEQFKEWQNTVVAKFAKLVEECTPATTEYFPTRYNNNFMPPVLTNACADYRIQRIRKQITRIALLAEDTVLLFDDDDLFNDIQLAQCLDEVPVV